MSTYAGTGFVKRNRATWTTPNLPHSTRGMHDWPPVAQEAWVWDVRLAAADVFASLWDCPKDDLISSMDRVCFVPYNRLKLNARTAKGWPHMDQSRVTRRGTLECVQGFVTLNPIGAGEVALTVYEGAHVHHAAFFKEHLSRDHDRFTKCAKADWIKFDEASDRAWFMAQPGVKEVRVHAPAGSLILWDSRLPHHAMPPADNAQRSTIDRYVVYVCMTPRAWATEDVLKKRIRSHETGRTTPHWPHDGGVFPLKPRLYSKDVTLLDPTFDPAKLQVAHLPEEVADYALLRRLVGYDE